MPITTPTARVRRARLALLAAPLFLALPALAQPAASTPRTARPPGRACPSQEFEAFLAAFERSAAVQRAFTRLPLPMRYLDVESAAPGGEPQPVEGVLSRAAVKFPIFPDPASRAQDQAHLRTERLTPERVKVTILGSDSGYRVVYLFERDTCWRLVLVDDQSM